MTQIFYYTFEDDLKKRLKDPEFRKAWEETEVEYQLAKKLIEKRLAKKCLKWFFVLTLAKE